ncbi:MAG: RDD family protein [Myxococcaceae bacterium]
MSKCLKCGATLPPTGECSSCHGEGLLDDALPSMLHRELSLDRRQGNPVPSQKPGVPSFADLSRTPQPPPMQRTPRPPLAPGQQRQAPPEPSRTPAHRTEPAVPRSLVPPAQTRAASAAPPAIPRSDLRAAPPPAQRTPLPPPVRTPRYDPDDDVVTPPPPRAKSGTPRPPPRQLEAQDEDFSDSPNMTTHTARPAPLWRRVAALAVDAAAIGTVVALYLTVALAVTGITPPTHSLGGLDAVMLRLHAWQPVMVPGLVLTLLICLVYSAVFAVIWEGRTPGRRLLGLRLVDASGLAPTPARASVRALLTTVSFAVFLGGFWLALFDRKGQTLHDKLTSTFIVIPT